MSESDISIKLRNDLADGLIRHDLIRSPGIEEAFRIVPRHLFTPGNPLDKVYSDISIPTKNIEGKLVSSSSQPAIMAIMLEQLQLQAGDRVLEIGAGTGYNAALMQYLVGESGLVVTLDIDEDIVEAAQDHLQLAGMDGVKVVCGDGGLGFDEYAPYNRIIVTAGAWDIAPAWWDQLKPGGRLLLPLELSAGLQKSIAFDLVNGHMESNSVADCGFMVLRGAYAKPEGADFIPFGPETGITYASAYQDGINGNRLYELLCGPREMSASGITAHPAEALFGGLALWLCLQESGLIVLSANGQSERKEVIPDFMIFQGGQPGWGTIGLVNDLELSVFARPPEPDVPPEFEFIVKSYGESTGLAQRLIEYTRAWDAAGRPSGKSLHVKAWPKDTDYSPLTGEFLIRKPENNIVLRINTI